MKKRSIFIISIAVIIVIAIVLILNYKIQEYRNEKNDKEQLEEREKEENRVKQERDSLIKARSQRMYGFKKAITDEKYYWAGHFDVYISANGGESTLFTRLEEYQFKNDGTAIKRMQTKDPITGEIGDEKYIGKWAYDETTYAVHFAWDNNLTEELDIVEINADSNEILLNKTHETYLPILYRKPLLDNRFIKD